jgi:tetratricopeptide (TPR) repeat protein
MADVFLSYARPSLKEAMRMADCLRAAGYSVWYDESLPAHRAYSDVIAEQLDAASAVLVLWSSGAAASQWVRSEANRARETGRLVQLRLDDARLPMPFDQIQCADLRRWSGGNSPGWNSVVAGVAALAGRPPDTGGTAPGPARPERRALLIGAAGAAVLAAGGWRLSRPHSPSAEAPSAEAQLLLQKGLDALQQNDALDSEQPGTAAQAIALLTKATEANPNSAPAWGGLAMAYATRWRASPMAERPGLAERTRSAAERAVALDPQDLRASAAVRMLDRVYRNWLAAERAAREALRLHPGFPIHIFLLSDVLGSVGRWREAAAISEKADRKKFLIPGADRKVVVNLWAAGRLQDADRALQEAVERWPENPQVWRTRLAYLLYSGQPSAALRLLEDEAARPAGISDKLVAAARATGAALTRQTPPAEATGANLAYLEEHPRSTPQVAQAFAAMGQGGRAMELLNGYYFGEGSWAKLAPEGGDAERVTAPLFMPPMRSLWRSADFAHLLDRIGLQEYWRQSRTIPDFRRAD